MSPAQPFVKCKVDSIEVNMLINTGSMRTIISNKIQAITGIENDKLDTFVSECCISITGGSLNILSHIPVEIKFCESNKGYKGNFLVSIDISYNCELGWDILVQNRLYQLVGPHREGVVGAIYTPSNGSVSGVLEGKPETSEIQF